MLGSIFPDTCAAQPREFAHARFMTAMPVAAASVDVRFRAQEIDPTLTGHRPAGAASHKRRPGLLAPAWACELAAWFALTEGRYTDVIDYAL